MLWLVYKHYILYNTEDPYAFIQVYSHIAWKYILVAHSLFDASMPEKCTGLRRLSTTLTEHSLRREKILYFK